MHRETGERAGNFLSSRFFQLRANFGGAFMHRGARRRGRRCRNMRVVGERALGELRTSPAEAEDDVGAWYRRQLDGEMATSVCCWLWTDGLSSAT